MTRISLVDGIEMNADLFQLRPFTGERAFGQSLGQIEAGRHSTLLSAASTAVALTGGPDTRSQPLANARASPDGFKRKVTMFELIDWSSATLDRQAKERRDAALAHERGGPVGRRARADLFVDTALLYEGHEHFGAQAVEGQVSDVRLKRVRDIGLSI